MALYDEILSANRRHAAEFELGSLAIPPARRPAVPACIHSGMLTLRDDEPTGFLSEGIPSVPAEV